MCYIQSIYIRMRVNRLKSYNNVDFNSHRR